MNNTCYRKNPFLSGNQSIKIGNDTVTSATIDGIPNITLTHSINKQDFIPAATEEISKVFQLTLAGKKALTAVLWQQQIHPAMDTLALDRLSLEEFIRSPYGIQMTIRTFQKGLSELTEKKVIARTARRGFYYINRGIIPQNGILGITMILQQQ
ncbi:hypothetical protein GBN23_06585 [Plesiomonas shigelloides]|uniref:hypothetical protein n=1 Tax=Plesiomonas shigelloides TaxID=703 RepID=UPI001261AEAA|nr:hypothetical protein [Plesiomonas shigelloides]KAB7680211.1 hypothetical protein GBN23_06585 [Plesiomonas shigelloides]